MASPEPKTAEDPAASTSSARSLLARRGVVLRGRSLRQHAARGVLVNSVFSIGLSLLALTRGLLIARFLTRAEYGVWGIVIATVATIALLRQIGIGDKFIQQEVDDAEAAFQTAFTLEAIVNAVFLVVLLAAAPAVAAAYGHHQLLGPMLLMALIVPANVLSAASWVFMRRMQWAAERWLSAIEPVVGTVIALALAASGAGYWSLVAGFLIGAWAGALAMVVLCPYRLRWRFDRQQLRSYLAFSWPLFVVNASVLVIAQAAYFFGNDALGLAAAGAITLSTTISQFSTQVDTIVSSTMYPVVCAIQTRRDLLYESFVKSNRVALMWAVPFGVGVALFAPDLVRFVIGERWRPAIVLLQVFGAFAAIGHFGFNWDDYFRARGETRPMAWAASITTVCFLAVAIPLIYTWGIKGFAVAVAAQTVVNVGCRVFFLRRLFDKFDMLRHAARASAPAIPAVVAIVLIRLIESGRRTAAEAALELVLFVTISIAATWGFEKRLVFELIGYLKGSAALEVPAEPGVT